MTISCYLNLLLLVTAIFGVELVNCRCNTINFVFGTENLSNGIIENIRSKFDRYYPNENCGWQISAPKGSKIRFSFQLIEIESSPLCSRDWVEIRDGFGFSKSLTGRICNDSLIGQWFETSDSVGFLHFQTDGTNQRRGFTVKWEKVVEEPELIRSPLKSTSGEVQLNSTNSNNSTNSDVDANFGLVISITAVVGVSFGVALFVVAGILICLVFPRYFERDGLAEKITSSHRLSTGTDTLAQGADYPDSPMLPLRTDRLCSSSKSLPKIVVSDLSSGKLNRRPSEVFQLPASAV